MRQRPGGEGDPKPAAPSAPPIFRIGGELTRNLEAGRHRLFAGEPLQREGVGLGDDLQGSEARAGCMASVKVPQRSIRQPGVEGRFPEIAEVGLIDQVPDLAGERMLDIRERPSRPSRTQPAWNSHPDNILKCMVEFHIII
jgi:hypothetical protein